MKVRRSYEKEVKKFQVGDQIQVGKYTATCVLIKGTKATFLLDQYLDKAFMHYNLLENLNAFIKKDKNFKEINKIAIPICKLNDGTNAKYRVPYAGEMFSGTSEDQWIRTFCEPDTKNGFLDVWPCMRNRRNRLADGEIEDYRWGWLMNKLKNKFQDPIPVFTVVTNSGDAVGYNSCDSNSVRPVFVISQD